MIPANLYPLFQHMNYTHNLTLLGTELQEIRDVVRLGDTIPTTTTNNMATIEKLKEAVAKVRAETGRGFVYAQVEVGGLSPDVYETTWALYAKERYHRADTLDNAIAAALAFDDKAERMAKAAALRAQAAELEAGAK